MAVIDSQPDWYSGGSKLALFCSVLEKTLLGAFHNLVVSSGWKTWNRIIFCKNLTLILVAEVFYPVLKEGFGQKCIRRKLFFLIFKNLFWQNQYICIFIFLSLLHLEQKNKVLTLKFCYIWASLWNDIKSWFRQSMRKIREKLFCSPPKKNVLVRPMKESHVKCFSR